LARSFLENRDVAAMASRAGSLPGSPAAITKSGDEELDAYLAGRAALYAGDSGRAFVAFQQVLDRYPEGRLRAGASYWLARSAAASGRSRDAAVAYYAALGSLWLDSSDRAAIATLVTSLKEGPDEALESVIEARPPRGSGEVRVSLKNLLQYLEDGREAMPDSVTLRQQLVTILLQVDWTIIQGDLDPRVLQAFRRIQSFYPRDVEVKDREVRVRASAESKIRNDSALKNEAAVIRRALPLMWR
jgi:hypothetical protein